MTTRNRPRRQQESEDSSSDSDNERIERILNQNRQKRARSDGMNGRSTNSNEHENREEIERHNDNNEYSDDDVNEETEDDSDDGVVPIEVEDINDEEVVGHNDHYDDNGPDVDRIQVDEIDDDEINHYGENNEPLEEQEPQNNEPTESDLNTNEDEELAEGPRSALFQGVQGNLRMNVPLRSKPDLTAMDLFLTSLAEAVRFHDSYEQILFKMRNIKLSFQHVNVPTYKKALWKVLGRDGANIVSRLYCSLCKEKIGKGTKPVRTCSCGACGPDLKETNVGRFLQVRLGPQLRDLLKIPGISEELNYRDRRVKVNENYIEDIYDGEKYKLLREEGNFLSNPNNFSLTLWVDGVKLSNSSSTVAYPILLQVNELSPNARKKHMLLAGIFVGTDSPFLTELLHPVIRDLRNLYFNGIVWTRDNVEVTSRFITPILTADSVAKPQALLMKQYNGVNGCITCLNPGCPEEGRRIYESQEYEMRTHASIQNDARIATIQGYEENGVKGISAFNRLPEFDLVDGVVVDVLHNSFLGVGKQFFEIIRFDVGEQWYIGEPNNLAQINSRLLAIKPPSKISRAPRDISTFRKWKASEWRNFILYYSLPCLDGILKNCYLKHWAKFCEATHIYTNSSISEEDLNRADTLITEFIRDFEQYGRKNMSFNVHLLSHEGRSVRHWGPLWAYSTFPFESLNRHIVAHVTSPYRRADQIVTRFLLKKFLFNALTTPGISPSTRNVISEVLNTSKVHVPDGMVNGHFIVGQGRKISRTVTNVEIRLLRDAQIPIARDFVIDVYQKAVIHAVEYQVADNVNRKFCNSFVYSTTGFWTISSFIIYNNEEGHVIGGYIGRRMRIIGTAYGTQYIKQVKPSEQTSFVRYQDVIAPAILITSLGKKYAVPLSNTWETD